MGVSLDVQSESIIVDEHEQSSDRDPLDLFNNTPTKDSTLTREIAKDGASTRRLRTKQLNAIAGPSSAAEEEAAGLDIAESEDAEQLSPSEAPHAGKRRRASTPKGNTVFVSDNVKNIVQLFEGNNFKKPPPTVDLTAKNLIRNMKGKAKVLSRRC